MQQDEAVIGCTGVLVIGTRGAAGPGEILVRVRGGSESFLAWSDEALASGSTALVIGSRGSRQVDVIDWTDPSDASVFGAGDAD